MTDEAPSGETMLEHIGGRERLKAFVDHFHHCLLEDELLAEMFGKARPTHSAHLVDFLEEVMGGRQLYTERHNGVEGLFDAHENLSISEPQRARFVELMMRAADEAGLPADERFRAALRQRIEAGSGFSMRLSQPGAQRLSPWPPVGTYEW
jgi:hemoglobin